MAALTSLEDLDALAVAIEVRFPDINPVRPLEVVGRGFRSLAIGTASGVVVRVGQSDDAAEDYAREWRIGSFLTKHLGSIVPEPRWYAAPGVEFPHGALGYVRLAGNAPEFGADPGATFARDLGAFLARLHALPTKEALGAGVRKVDSYRRVIGARGVVMPTLAPRLAADSLERLEAWWRAFTDDSRMQATGTAVCHHDLWHDNLLRSDSGHLSGVLDIAHVEVGDPAHDFPAPRYFGHSFMQELVAAYRAGGGSFDENVEYRAQRYWEAREFGGLAWAIEHDDALEIDEAVEKIRWGPILARV